MKILMPWEETHGDIFARYNYGKYRKSYGLVYFHWSSRTWTYQVRRNDGSLMFFIPQPDQKTKGDAIKIADEVLIDMGFKLLNDGDKLLALL